MLPRYILEGMEDWYSAINIFVRRDKFSLALFALSNCLRDDLGLNHTKPIIWESMKSRLSIWYIWDRMIYIMEIMI